MPALSRNRLFLPAVAAVVIGAGGAAFMVVEGRHRTAEAAAAEAASERRSPYLAVANGKADVEGGIIQVAARRAGVVSEVLVQEGDQVSRGQILARLEDNEPRLAAHRAEAEVAQARAQVAATEVQLASAQREVRRLESLVASNFVAGQRLDQARDAVRNAQADLAAQRAAVATAEAGLAQSRYELELRIIRAPSDGRIVRRYANPGAGASTLNVSNMFDLEPKTPRIVRAEIPEASLPNVAIGQFVEMTPESDSTKTYRGQVIRQAPVFGARKLQSDDPSERADERVVEVVVTAEGAPFLIGQRVLVKFLRPQPQAGSGPAPRS